MESNLVCNRICNKILARDWFSARLFVTLSAHDHVGVQLQVSDLNLVIGPRVVQFRDNCARNFKSASRFALVRF